MPVPTQIQNTIKHPKPKLLTLFAVSILIYIEPKRVYLFSNKFQ